jgi:Domain of unknown function (DUF4349)
MRWSDRKEDEKLEALLRGEDDSRLGTALVEMREQVPEAPEELRERIRTLAAEEARVEPPPRRARFGGNRLSFARVGAIAAAALVVAVAIPAVVGIARDGAGDETSSSSPAPQASVEAAIGGQLPPRAAEDSTGSGDGLERLMSPQAAPPPPPAAADKDTGTPSGAAPLPSTNRAQDYSASIRLHVDNPDELSEAVQSAIRSTRQLGGYVTYVDYGTSGAKEGEATLAVRVPVGRVQSAIAGFSELGTILEQQTEIVDLQGRIDRITRDIQQRRDRIAKLEAELQDPTLSETERDRLETRLVQAKRGLANATSERAGVLRQSRFAKLDLAFTTEKSNEPAPPPSELRKTLDDAVGILAAELGVLLFVVIAGAPFIALALLAWLGARTLRRGANQRILEQA